MNAAAWAAVGAIVGLVVGGWATWQLGREHGYEEHRAEINLERAEAEPMDPPDGELVWLRAYDGGQWWSYHRDGPWHPYPVGHVRKRIDWSMSAGPGEEQAQ